MTNTTLREDFTKKFFSLETDKNPYTGKYESNFFVKKEKTLAEFLDFIESKVEEAREEMARFISSEMYYWNQIASEKLDHVLKRAINYLK